MAFDAASSAPARLTATAGDGQVRLAWSHAGAAGGRARIERRHKPTEALPFTAGDVWVELPAGAVRDTVRGLQSAQSYTFEVRARSATGASEAARVSATAGAGAQGAVALQARAERVVYLSGAGRVRGGTSDRVELGEAGAVEQVAGSERTRIGGRLSEAVGGSVATRASRVHTVLCAGLERHVGSETTLLAGGMSERQLAAVVDLAGMSDDLVVGGGMRATTMLDVWLCAVVGMEEKVASAHADAAVVERFGTTIEREYGAGTHVAGVALLRGTVHATLAAGLWRLLKVSMRVRNLTAGSGDGGGAPTASQPAAEAASGEATAPGGGDVASSPAAGGIEEVVEAEEVAHVEEVGRLEESAGSGALLDADTFGSTQVEWPVEVEVRRETPLHADRPPREHSGWAGTSSVPAQSWAEQLEVQQGIAQGQSTVPPDPLLSQSALSLDSPELSPLLPHDTLTRSHSTLSLDSFGLPPVPSDPLRSHSTLSLDSFGPPTVPSDPLPSQSTLSLDSFGLPPVPYDPLRSHSTLSLDSFGLPTVPSDLRPSRSTPSLSELGLDLEVLVGAPGDLFDEATRQLAREEGYRFVETIPADQIGRHGDLAPSVASSIDPGIIDPGIIDPGIIDPGIIDPGIIDPEVREALDSAFPLGGESGTGMPHASELPRHMDDADLLRLLDPRSGPGPGPLEPESEYWLPPPRTDEPGPSGPGAAGPSRPRPEGTGAPDTVDVPTSTVEHEPYAGPKGGQRKRSAPEQGMEGEPSQRARFGVGEPPPAPGAGPSTGHREPLSWRFTAPNGSVVHRTLDYESGFKLRVTTQPNGKVVTYQTNLHDVDYYLPELMQLLRESPQDNPPKLLRRLQAGNSSYTYKRIDSSVLSQYMTEWRTPAPGDTSHLKSWRKNSYISQMREWYEAGRFTTPRTLFAELKKQDPDIHINFLNKSSDLQNLRDLMREWSSPANRDLKPSSSVTDK